MGHYHIGVPSLSPHGAHAGNITRGPIGLPIFYPCGTHCRLLWQCHIGVSALRRYVPRVIHMLYYSTPCHTFYSCNNIWTMLHCHIRSLIFSLCWRQCGNKWHCYIWFPARFPYGAHGIEMWNRHIGCPSCSHVDSPVYRL